VLELDKCENVDDDDEEEEEEEEEGRLVCCGDDRLTICCVLAVRCCDARGIACRVTHAHA
jgi:hypothetical protein